MSNIVIPAEFTVLRSYFVNDQSFFTLRWRSACFLGCAIFLLLIFLALAGAPYQPKPRLPLVQESNTILNEVHA